MRTREVALTSLIRDFNAAKESLYCCLRNGDSIWLNEPNLFSDDEQRKRFVKILDDVEDLCCDFEKVYRALKKEVKMEGQDHD